MKEKKVQGEGTFNWQFDSKTISLAIDSDPYGGDFSFLRSRYDSTFEIRSIGGHQAEYLRLDLNKPDLKNWSFNADGSTKVKKEEKNLFLGINFPNQHISFVTTRTSGTSPEVAEDILNSIDLK